MSIVDLDDSLKKGTQNDLRVLATFARFVAKRVALPVPTGCNSAPRLEATKIEETRRQSLVADSGNFGKTVLLHSRHGPSRTQRMLVQNSCLQQPNIM